MGSRLLTLAPLMALLTSVVIARPLTVQDEQQIKADFVQSRIEAIESSSDLDAGVRTSLLAVHRDALAQLQKADAAAARAAEADRLAAEAPAQLEKIRAGLAEPVVDPQPEFLDFGGWDRSRPEPMGQDPDGHIERTGGFPVEIARS